MMLKEFKVKSTSALIILKPMCIGSTVECSVPSSALTNLGKP